MQEGDELPMRDDEPLPRPRTAVVFGCLVVAVAFWQVWRTMYAASGESLLDWIEPNYQPSGTAIACGMAILLLAGLSLWRPILGMIAITWVAFGVARGTPEMEWSWDRGFQTAVVVIVAMGACGNPVFRARVKQLWCGKTVWLRVVLALVVWTVVTELVALLTNDRIALPKHSALRLLESLTLLALMAAAVRNASEVRILITAAALALITSVLQKEGFEGRHDLAFAAAPLACLALGAALSGPLAWLFFGAILSLGLAGISLATANRAANLGMAFGVVVLLVLNVRRPLTIVFAGLVLCVVGFAAFHSPLRPRLEEWAEDGWETSTLASRIELWTGAIEVAPSNLLFGVGPGRGGQQMSEHLQLGKWKATHSSPLEIFGEQGVLGLLLWILLVVLAFHAGYVGACSNEAWVRGLGLGAISGLVAVVIAGLALSRHDDIRFFWIMGMAFASKSAESQLNLKKEGSLT